MLSEILEGIRDLIGVVPEDLTFWQMALRAAIIYITAITLVRLGDKRFMGKNTAFDVILGIILGSVLSRAITGNAGFFQTIGAGAILVGLHWTLSWLTFHFSSISAFIKGGDRKLVENGEIIWENMHKSHIGENDLMSALRTHGQVLDISEVKVAHFERNGDISVIRKAREPQIVEVAVQEGVQKVRIEINC
jgi:uncharacterized membrane protein YcaP (DUF421 family)